MLSVEQLAKHVAALPSDRLPLATALMARLYPPTTRASSTGRNIDQRRAYAGDPHRYVRDVLGWTLSPQQDEALGWFEQYDRVLVPAGNGIGKTFLLAAYAVYRMDAVAALPDPERGFEEQGAQILLPGPDEATIFSTVFQAMLEHCARAESRGFPMPGVRSTRSVLWHVRPRWFVEPFSPPRRVDQDVRHTASGRHHTNQCAIIEEGQGVDEPTWRAVEGMCSGTGNKILSAYNPTEESGPASSRERAGTYRALHLTALDHPNVIHRAEVIPGAVGYLVIDGRVRDECRDHGPYPEVQPDPNEGDFLYALPTLEQAEAGGRADGVRGHPYAAIRVFRPGGFFDPQVRGLYPRSGTNTLCDPAAWDAAVVRWKAAAPLQASPDRVGLDPARLGNDEPCAVPSWGGDAEQLLRRFEEFRVQGVDISKTVARARCGMPLILKKGDGPDLAAQVDTRWPKTPVNCDEGGVGTSSLDHARRVMKRDWLGVSFGARPEWMDRPLHGEPFCENLRTLMYVRAGRLVTAGLVDVPECPLLRQEFLAHYTEVRWRIIETVDAKRGLIKERRPSMLLCDKEKIIKKKIGRSPDRADAFVLSLFGGGRMRIEYRGSRDEQRISDPERAGAYDDAPTRDGRLFGGSRGTW